MKISRLLEIQQEKTSLTSLEKNFGDSFLVQHNRIYKIIRKQALQAGFSYSTEFNASYVALPLSQLDHLLQTKKIPYFDNVSILQEIEQKIPKSTNWDEVVDNLKKNYLFHESCHAVARTSAQKIFTTNDSPLTQIVRQMIEESFANSCELIGIIDAEDAAHRIFYEANSYIFVYDMKPHLKNLVQEHGVDFVIQFMIFCYLYSNFLFDSLNDQSLDRILKLLKPDSNDLTALKKNTSALKKIRAASRIAFELNPRFRQVTTGFYLRWASLNPQQKDLTRFDFMPLIESDQRMLKLIHSLSKQITNSF